ncbi:MAG: hypothetical protein IKU43_04860 [Clostridia bacterium]|nr:hypothetical protein [Clostridia bacterium]
MIITRNFSGANITVQKINGDTVYLENQIRDTTEDWFYWAFRVDRANGRTVKFQFNKKVRVGYYGAAKSYDLKTWEWTGKWDDESSFTYTFGENEDTVYFAHCMVYSPEMFDDFCGRCGIEKKVLCKTKKGRDVPYIEIGEGEEVMFLTARHHACESTGNYVLEGLIEQYLKNPLPNIRVICVPFVDFDGVVDGDQGKARAPFDHNRDYPRDGESIYASTRRIREIANENKIRYAFDFHAPWHFTGENDTVFIVRNSHEKLAEIEKFGRLLEAGITPESLPYKVENDHAPDTTWSKTTSPTFANYMLNSMGADLSFTLETTYFKANDGVFSQKGAIELGRCFYKAIKGYNNK